MPVVEAGGKKGSRMKADQQTYRKAAFNSVLGLIFQFLFGVTLLIFAFNAGNGVDHAIMTAAIFTLLGVLVWLALAILFDQHRRERIEAMEAEALDAQDALASSAFEQSAGELRVAARRLQFIERWVLPSFSAVTALSLLGVGIPRLTGALALYDPGSEFVPPTEHGWALAIGLFIAVLGFVYARYTSGMAKQKVWSLLQAGAAYLVGAALFAALLAAAHIIAIATERDVALRLVMVALPLITTVVGVEMVLNLIGGFYSARRPGEPAKAAFNLKSLGLLAAPDRIVQSVAEAVNYQFGVNVSETWFFRVARRWWAAVVLFGALVAWGLSCVVVIAPDQRGMILTNGQIDPDNPTVGPGLHFKMPYPIGQLYIPPYTVERGGREVELRTVSGLRQIGVGSPEPGDDTPVILWTDPHVDREEFLIVQPAPTVSRVGGSTPGVAGDVSLVAVEVPVTYRVNDVESWAKMAQDDSRELLLEAVGRREVTLYVSSLRADQVLSIDRDRLARELRAQIALAYARTFGDDGDESRIIDIVAVAAEGLHPPTGAAASFENLVRSRQVIDRQRERAQKDAAEALIAAAGSTELAEEIIAKLDEIDRLNERGADADTLAAATLEAQRLIESAGGTAGRRLSQASAERWVSHMSERGRAALYVGELASYNAAPMVYAWSRYFEALAESTRDVRVYMVDPRMETMRVQLNLEESQFGPNFRAGIDDQPEGTD